jgi:hypothetical protein
MNTVEMLQYSLDNAFGILGQVTGDLTQEQADWTPPGIANPIGATYWHAISGVDEIVHKWGQEIDPLNLKEGWQERVLAVTAPEPEQGGDWLTYMQAIRVDLPQLHEYSERVCDQVRIWVRSLSPADLERQIKTPVGELNLGQMLETFVVWHVNAHCGEIAALKGCQGARGYLF